MGLGRSVGLLVIAFVLGCEDLPPSLPDPGPDAGPDGSVVLADATDAELAMLCDWVAGRVGGYDRRHTCGDVFIRSQASQETCVENLKTVPPACQVTFHDVEGCANAVIADMCPGGGPPTECFDLFSCATAG